jgi:phosphoribosylanthranilate isomerase
MSKQALKIKVCGMRHPGNLEQVCALGPDFVGFIFYSGSKRYVGSKADPALFRIPPAGMKKVGVFVNEEAEQVRRTVERFGLDLVQLHGAEMPSYCDDLRRVGIPVIKALVPENAPPALEAYAGTVDAFLFDSPGRSHGGTGRKFNWEVLGRMNHSLPFMLSGGIGPEDASALLALGLKEMSGIDLNSMFEVEPGIKDVALLGPFINEIRK